VRYTDIFILTVSKKVDHFGLIKELRVFEGDILKLDCDLLVIFNANGFVDLSERSLAKLFDNFILFSD